MQASEFSLAGRRVTVLTNKPQDNNLVELCKTFQTASLEMISGGQEIKHRLSLETDLLVVTSEQQWRLESHWPDCPVPVLNDFELMQRLFPRLHYIAVTGSNGKTTTSLGIEHLLKCLGYNAYQAGHAADDGFGLSPATACLQMIREESSADFIICEMACHQTEHIGTFRPQTAVFTNFFPLPPPRYQSVKDYLNAKRRLFTVITDTAILNCNDETLRGLVSEIRAPVIWFGREKVMDQTGVYAVESHIWLFAAGKRQQLASKEDVQLVGQHNLENVLAMIAVVYAVLGDFDVVALRKGIQTFGDVVHRMEFVRKVHGITFINDSNSTSVAATLNAVQAINTQVILILGGAEIGNSYVSVADFQKRVSVVLAIGENRQRIVEELGGAIPVYNVMTLESAIKWVERYAPRGVTVLLSPGTTSRDQFRDCRERGNIFKRLIHRIPS